MTGQRFTELHAKEHAADPTFRRESVKNLKESIAKRDHDYLVDKELWTKRAQVTVKNRA